MKNLVVVKSKKRTAKSQSKQMSSKRLHVLDQATTTTTAVAETLESSVGSEKPQYIVQARNPDRDTTKITQDCEKSGVVKTLLVAECNHRISRLRDANLGRSPGESTKLSPVTERFVASSFSTKTNEAPNKRLAIWRASIHRKTNRCIYSYASKSR